MKRRDFLKLMAGAVGYFSLYDAFFKNTAECADLKNGYHIVLISDLHLPWRNKKFPKVAEGKKIFAQKEKMLANIKSLQAVREIELLGDFPARYGNEEEFLSVDKFLSEIDLPKFIVVGNHDYAYKSKPGKNGKLERATHDEQLKKLNDFKERYKMPSLYYARNIGNYKLIYLSPDVCGNLNIEFSKTQLEWLKNEILNHSNAPIIFFCHAPLKGTLLNYGKNINKPQATAQPENELAEILKYAPKHSLWISGHTHTSVSNPSFADDNINRYNDNIINIHNPTIDSKNLCTNSLFLYDDRIVVKTFNHKDNKWIERLTREYNVNS